MEGADPFSQKLSRSKKTLVKQGNVKENSRKTPLVIEDDDASKEPSPKKAKARRPSPKKVTQEPDENPPPPIATLPPPTPSSPKSSPSKKSFSYRDYLMRKASGPIAPGSKEIPQGAPNCLAGLTFVFTGELDSLSREEAQDLVKRHGGRVTSAPSGKTNYVVVGREAGASKLEKINSLRLSTLNEDELLQMVRESNSMMVDSEQIPAGKIPAGKIPAEKASAEKVPAEKVSTERSSRSSNVPVEHQQPTKLPSLTIVHPEFALFKLWTDKYAPQDEKDLIGNHSNYEKILQWTPNVSEKAILISGPPGIGKTTAANMACKKLEMEVVEMNASDTRSKSSLHEHVRDIIDNRTLAGFSDFFAKVLGSGMLDKVIQENGQSQNVYKYHKQVLIMDEVDGMSSGDRGGMAELIQLIKKTKIPIICICNDRSSPKVRSLANYCLDLRFRRPDARSVTPRIMAIAKKEGLELGVNTIEELVASTQSDIRQILNLLSTYRLTSSLMDYDQSKLLGHGSKKDLEQGPFDAVPALLGPGYDRMSLPDKIDQYFVDSSLVPLMVQENYIKCKANNARTVRGKTGGQSFMELCAEAADSISEADLVDSLIRGANQEWSLAPLHSIMSCVRPAYYCHGGMSSRVEFASWLGHNSKRTKNWRLLGELSKHTYLHCQADRSEMRACQIPFLARKLLAPLKNKGAEGIDETIAVMDQYSLSREDFDSILELVLDPDWNMSCYTKIPTTVKTAFTRKYNQGVHKLPYAVGSSMAPVKKILVTEGAAAEPIDEEDTNLVMADNGADQDDDDLSKDKMIKAKTTSTKSTRGGGGRGRGRGK